MDLIKPNNQTTKKEKKKMARKSSKKRRFAADKLMKRMKKSKASMRGSRNVIDMEKIGDVNIWQPKDGDHTIDVIPYFAGSNDPNVKKDEPTYLFPYSQHPRIGAAEEQVLCPAATFGDPCPICEDRMKLREQGQDKEIWKPLFPKDRAIYNIICYDQGEEKKGVQIWDISRFYFENPVLKLAMRKGRAKTGTIFQDPENGKSIVFEIEPAKSKDDFPSYVGIAFEDRDYEIDDDILDQAIALDETVKVLSYEEIKDLYFGGKVESKSSKRKPKDSDDEEEDENLPSTDELMEQLEDCEDLDDLDEFIEENNFEVEINKKSRFNKVKRELKKLIIEMEMDDDDEDEDDEDNEEQDYTWGEIKKMNPRKLKKVIKDEDLDVDPDDAEDTDELREMVADELDISY